MSAITVTMGGQSVNIQVGENTTLAMAAAATATSKASEASGYKDTAVAAAATATEAAEDAAADGTAAANAVLADFDAGLSGLTETTEGLNSSETVAYTEAVSAGRFHSPDPLNRYIVTPIFEGVDLDTAVVPTSIVVTGKNIVNADPSLWEVGQINTSGVNAGSGSQLRTIGMIPISPSTQYSRRGTIKPFVTLYDASGTFKRQFNVSGGTLDTWVTAVDETQMRLHFVNSAAVPTDAFDAQLQVEQSAVPTAFAEYTSETRTYDAVELFKNGTAIDKVTGPHYKRAVIRRTIAGTASGSAFGIASAVSSGTDYYSGTLADQTGFLASTKALLTGLSSEGDYALNATSTTQARGIWVNSTNAARIAIAKVDVDAQAGADTLAKFRAYLDAYPVEAIFDEGSYATPTVVGSGVLVLPEGGSIVLTATGGTTHSVEFREVSASGGGGGSSATRLSAVEGDITAMKIVDTDLQSQIDDLVVGGDSSVEAAQARSAAMGVAFATLKARLDSIDLRAPLSVKDFGAKGDGIVDPAVETQAFLDARDAAESLGVPLHIPPCSGRYRLTKGVLLTTSATVTGDWAGRIEKVAAVTSDVNGAVSIGDTVIPVDNATPFASKVGYDVYVGPASVDPSYNGTRGVITAVDTGANTITIDSYNSSDGNGMRVAYADGEAVLSTTFPMFYTDNVVTPGVTISPNLIGLHLDGNKQPGEPMAYTCASIHFDPVHVTAPMVLRCITNDSPSEGISNQGEGYAIIAFNRAEGCAARHYHPGFTNSGELYLGNYVKSCGLAAMFFSFANTNSRLIGNFFENCPIGFASISGDEADLLFIGNITKGCGIDYEIVGADNGVVQITDMLSIGNTSKIVSCDSAKRLKVSGSSRGASAVGVELLRTTESEIDIAFHDFTGTYNVIIGNTGAVRSDDITVLGQLRGASVASVLVRSSDYCMINPSVSKPSGSGKDFIFETAAGQPAPTGSLLGVGIRRGTGITALGTNTDAMA